MSRKALSFWQMLEQDVVILVPVGMESPHPKDVTLLEALQLKGVRGDQKSKIMSYRGSLKEFGGVNLEKKCLSSRKQCYKFNCSLQWLGMGLKKISITLKIQHESWGGFPVVRAVKYWHRPSKRRDKASTGILPRERSIGLWSHKRHG